MLQNMLWLDKKIFQILQEKATSAAKNVSDGAKFQLTQVHRRECGNLPHKLHVLVTH